MRGWLADAGLLKAKIGREGCHPDLPNNELLMSTWWGADGLRTLRAYSGRSSLQGI
jgi:hypothetical protein